MKKKLLLTLALMTVMVATAQVSVQMGYLLNTQNTKDALGNHSDSYSGLMLSADYNFSLTGQLSVTPGLGMGYSFDNSDNKKYKEFGLFVPVDVNYRFPMADRVSLSLFAGPTFYYGLVAKNTATSPVYNYYDNDSHRFELLLGGGVWLDINETIRLKADYKFGLTNTSKIDGITEKNNCMYLSVGYLF